jgi:hypothetical protein
VSAWLLLEAWGPDSDEMTPIEMGVPVRAGPLDFAALPELPDAEFESLPLPQAVSASTAAVASAPTAAPRRRRDAPPGTGLFDPRETRLDIGDLITSPAPQGHPL